MKKAIVIFDFDGPILDSFEEGLRRLAQVIKRYGITLGDEEYSRIRARWGKPGRVMLQEALGVSGLFADEVYREWVELDNRAPPPLVRGAKEALERLSADSALLAMLTSRHREELERPLAHHRLQEFFALIQTADCGEFHKPDYRVFWWMFRNLATKLQGGEYVVFVGDTLADLEAGVGAGIDTVLVATGPHDPEFVRMHGSNESVRSYFIRHPDRFLSSIAEFPWWLQKYTHAVPA